MSGAVAAHASYNGSGTQGLAVTNKITPAEGDVMSVFWNKNDTTRQLLYGSSTIEIPSSGTGGTASFGGSQVFTVNNDIDCLGDMYVAINLKVDTSTGNYLDPYFLAKVINRVEFQVGTQVWQTLENKDILDFQTMSFLPMGYKYFKNSQTLVRSRFDDLTQSIEKLKGSCYGDR